MSPPVQAASAGDRITLVGLEGHGRHGVLESERASGQVFRVDVVLGLDTRPAAASDDLADTVDYGALALDVLGVVEGEPVDLIETLAHRIAGVCLADVRVQWTEVTVHKPAAPIDATFSDVAVTIHRSRQ
ncbi:MAG: Dihydroneopterin aldolase [uncultured Nocardioidaceae bacterium]|uniref:7,8-dihydroneopterin aldolase n=1 Tax=uncultured Nocardioidaceae bacterium TaxID=253824 RepID=A0A6J4LNQ3_9ACTN|nr:MAG: Dihydroneopterin aldolase [uncultured Nocardioidaceae bacterium]